MAAATKKDTDAQNDDAQNGQDSEAQSQPTEQDDWRARALAAENALAKRGEDAPTKGQNLPPFFLVRATHPDSRKRILFRSVSQKRAEAFITRYFPRGSEAYLEDPDGKFWHYEHERQGEYGTDADQWLEFDPESWKPPTEQEPPGENAWADRHG